MTGQYDKARETRTTTSETNRAAERRPVRSKQATAVRPCPYSKKMNGIFKLDKVCKEPLPAPGNRSNERRYKEKDLARTEEKKVGTGERERAVAKKNRGREK
ncbi:hypothetical protein TNCV_3068781 [Trichonephila clavipes]|nr:hypothetical protein TNCV_3068781 [Trichonephila clavipes]